MRRFGWYTGILLAMVLLLGTAFSGSFDETVPDRQDKQQQTLDDPAPEPVYIGFIGPLTGAYAEYGITMSRAAELAVEQRNADGGLYQGRQVRLVIEDSEGEPYRGETVMKKMLQVDGITALVGCVFSSVSLQVAPLAEADKVVMISPASTHPALTRDNRYVFRTISTDGQQASVLARYVREELKLERAAILSTDNQYSSQLSSTFSRVFQEAGGRITAMETVRTGEADFMQPLMRIMQSRPQALYLPNDLSNTAEILKLAGQILPGTVFLGSDSCADPDIFQLAGSSAEGLIFTNQPELTGKQAGQEESFKKAYYKKTGQNATPFAANSYDAANLLMDGIDHVLKQEGTLLKRDLIRTYITSITGYNGAGGRLGFYPDGDVIKSTGIFKISRGSSRQTGVYLINKERKLVKE